MTFSGPFESHLTLRLPDAAALAALQHWTTHRPGLKCTHILLDRGVTASQPMLTAHAHGSLSDQIAAADTLRRQLAAEGFDVIRLKLEVDVDNPDVPTLDSPSVPGYAADRYFEHHIKLLLPASFDERARDELTALAQRHQSHLSRNALRTRDDGRHERFVTQRCYAVGRRTAQRQLDALLHDLARADYTLLDIEREYVVFDTNIQIDAGWIEPPPLARGAP